MSMWKPILNQAHFDRMHKTKPHQEKVLLGEQHEGTILIIALKNIINFLKTIGLRLKI